jgi:hypothetical protein
VSRETHFAPGRLPRDTPADYEGFLSQNEAASFRPMLEQAFEHDGPALLEVRVHRLDGSGS